MCEFRVEVTHGPIWGASIGATIGGAFGGAFFVGSFVGGICGFVGTAIEATIGGAICAAVVCPDATAIANAAVDCRACPRLAANLGHALEGGNCDLHLLRTKKTSSARP